MVLSRESCYSDSQCVPWRTFSRTGRKRFRFLIDEFLQFLTGLEVRHLLRRDVHAVAGFRVPALPRLALPQAKAAEPPQLDLLAAMQCVDDALEHGVDDDFG